LTDLRNRLNNSRFPVDSPGTEWEYGTNIDYMKELTAYWKNTYLDQWKGVHEKKLNSMQQFVTEIDGLKIHFVHVKSKVEGATPLLLSHGWPGSFFECSKVVSLLTDPESHDGTKEEAFHLVCPSLPGYGFSQAPKEKGFTTKQMAKTFIKLMAILGYDKYVAQGGDWGYLISVNVALNDPEHCIGLHLNAFLSSSLEKPGAAFKSILKAVSPSFLIDNSHERAHFSSLLSFLFDHAGYAHLQGTKPDTVGFGLSDSPVGLAAYIIEKFHGLSDCNGSIENSFTKDDLLTNVMIYWISNSITSSMRLYYEMFHQKVEEIQYVSQPSALALFKELTTPPINQLNDFLNLVQLNKMPSGGHFAALEEPTLLVNDIRKFVGLLHSLKKTPSQNTEL